MIVDSEYRRSIGRPWLSLAIDVATRAVLGFHVGLEAPSALAVRVVHRTRHAAQTRPSIPSAPEASWIMSGSHEPFMSTMVRSFTVKPSPRLRGIRHCADPSSGRATPIRGPYRAPHGTMMGRIHLLPGSTDSSPSRRGSYKSEEEARLTLAEFTEWLYLEDRRPISSTAFTGFWAQRPPPPGPRALRAEPCRYCPPIRVAL